MRKSLARKLVLSTAITALIAIPAAFAHNHHAGSASAGRHGGFGRHSFASADSRSDTRGGNQSFSSDDRNQSATASLGPNSRRHERIPDEEEVEQPEQ